MATRTDLDERGRPAGSEPVTTPGRRRPLRASGVAIFGGALLVIAVLVAALLTAMSLLGTGDGHPATPAPAADAAVPSAVATTPAAPAPAPRALADLPTPDAGAAVVVTRVAGATAAITLRCAGTRTRTARFDLAGQFHGLTTAVTAPATSKAAVRLDVLADGRSVATQTVRAGGQVHVDTQLAQAGQLTLRLSCDDPTTGSVSLPDALLTP
jgi:hypothetical protein